MENLNIVIVTFKNRDLLDRCLQSVRVSAGQVDFETIVTVVDNGSKDGTGDLVRKSYPEVQYIENKQNLGLTRAINTGIRVVKNSVYTLIMNDDVLLFPETIRLMLDTLGSYPHAGGIPANLMRPDGSYQRMKLNIIGLTHSKRNKIRYANFAGTTACMYRTEVLYDIGLFDEFFFFYNEDLDFSLRAKRRGVRFIFNPDVKVIHYKTQGRKKGEREIKPHFYATNYYFYRKNYGKLVAGVYLLFAYVHMNSVRRGLMRTGEQSKVEVLDESRQKLQYTVRNFKDLLNRSYA